MPLLLLAVPLRLWVDRHPRRRPMAAVETPRALSLAVQLWAVAAEPQAIMLLAVLGLLAAAGTVGFSVAAPALVPALVPRQALDAATLGWR